MSRRRHEEPGDALELFLDAISNMFGGVLFIALAVVVLLQFSVALPADDAAPSATDAPPDTAPDAPPDAPAIREALRVEVAALEAFLAGDSTEQSATGDDPQEHARVVGQLAEGRHALQEMRDAEARLREAVAAQREELAGLTARRTAAERSLAEAQRRLREAEGQPPQRVRAARFRGSDKREVPWLLRTGRLTPAFVYGADGTERGVNRAALLLDAETSTARPRPGRGTAVTAAADTQARLTEMLRVFDPGRDYIAVAVWPDSFEEARVVRDALIDLGFDYGLHFVAAGGGVPFNATGGVQ